MAYIQTRQKDILRRVLHLKCNRTADHVSNSRQAGLMWPIIVAFYLAHERFKDVLIITIILK